MSQNFTVLGGFIKIKFHWHEPTGIWIDLSANSSSNNPLNGLKI